MLTRTLHSSTTKSAENTVAGLQQAPLVVSAHADAGAAIGCTTSSITRLWVAEVVDLTQNGREEGEGCTSSEDTLAHCLAGEGLAVEVAPIAGVVRVADWSRQQAHLRDEEGHPVKGDETCYWWSGGNLKFWICWINVLDTQICLTYDIRAPKYSIAPIVGTELRKSVNIITAGSWQWRFIQFRFHLDDELRKGSKQAAPIKERFLGFDTVALSLLFSN